MKFRYIDQIVLQTSFLYKKVHFLYFEKGKSKRSAVTGLK